MSVVPSITPLSISAANLSDADALTAIREVEKGSPLPKSFTDAEILKRVRDAEKKVVRGSARATIVIGADFPKAVAELIEALASSPAMFQHLGRLTTIVHQPEKCKFAKVDNGAPRLSFVPRDGMLEVMRSAADWHRIGLKTRYTSRSIGSTLPRVAGKW